MQVSFAKRISTLDNSSFTFLFNRIYTVNGTAYHISVRTIGSVSNHFMMEEKNGGWYFTDITLLPQWIIELERRFENVIQENINAA